MVYIGNTMAFQIDSDGNLCVNRERRNIEGGRERENPKKDPKCKQINKQTARRKYWKTTISRG